MRADQLLTQPVQRVQMGGIHNEPADARLVVWGLHGGSEFVTGLQIDGVYVERVPGETCDALRIRAMRTVTPNLPATALRDSKGAAVGYFTYSGLPLDHCKAIAENEGKL